MNFPRLGVQNPQFTNVYEMERNAQANRPFAQLLNTGAKVIPAYIDQQKKEAEAQQLKDATNERNAFISNYGQGFVGGLTSPQSFMPKMTELDPTAANQLMDARKANAPKPPATQNLTDDKRAVYNSALQQLSSLRASGVQETDPVYKEYRDLADIMKGELVKENIIPQTAEPKNQPIAEPVSTENGSNIEQANADALGLVQGAEDKDGDGVIDNILQIRSSLDGLSRKYNINTKSPEWVAISNLLDVQKDAVERRAKERKAEESRQLELAGKKQSLKAGQASAEMNIDTLVTKNAPMFDVWNELNNSPNSVGSRTLALDQILRNESGAAIGKTEVRNRLATVLSDADVNELMSDQGFGNVLTMINSGASDVATDKLIQKYIQRMDVEKAKRTVKAKISPKAFELLSKKSVQAETSEPKTESKLERIRRLREGKKQ